MMKQAENTKKVVTHKLSKYQLVAGTMERFWVRFSTVVRRTMIKNGEKKNIKRKKHLIEKVTLTPEQKQEINSFFESNYKKKMPYSWHRLYQSYTGTYRYNYFPEILLSTKLEFLWNPYREADFLGDKNLLDPLFGTVPGVHIPKTFLSSVKGRIRAENLEMLDFGQACAKVANIGRCVIKKTTETNSGRDVALCDLQNGMDLKTGLSVDVLLAQFGKDFVVQEQICQCDALSQLNATSLNTFRVMTYILDGQIYHCPPALRLGRSNADKDNIHYGGICIGITEEGFLRESAFSEEGDAFVKHPDSQVIFSRYEIQNFSKVIESAHALHARVPYLGIISWDLSIDKDGTPVLIEMNTTRQSAWFCQMVNGEPLFGENTAKILQLIAKSR